MRDIWTELRYTARPLFRSPLFCITVVVTLTIGIGATTTVYSILYATIFPTYSYGNPERLVSLKKKLISPSILDYVRWKEENRMFEELTTYTMKSLGWVDDGEPVRVNGIAATANVFRMAGVQPFLGRGFSQQEDMPGKGNVVVLGYKFWKTRYNGNTRILGENVTINNKSFTIIGVMPAGKGFPNAEVEAWTPWILDEDPNRDKPEWSGAKIAGLLKDGISFESAQKMPPANDYSEPFILQRFGETRDERYVWLFFAAVVMLLVIACINIASLITARGEARAGDIAVHSALGAPSSRIVRQMLIECMMLSLAGGIAGIVLAFWGVRTFYALKPPQLVGSGIAEASMNLPTLAFAFAVSFLTALICGLVPSFRVSKTDLTSALKKIGKTGSRSSGIRGRSLLVVAELALATVLLAGAGLIVKTFYKLLSVELGFNIDNIATVTVTPLQKWIINDTRRNIFADEVLRRVRHVPQVLWASASSAIPLGQTSIAGAIFLSPDMRTPPQTCEFNWVNDDFFRTFDIPIHMGREFSKSTRVVVENEVVVSKLAARLFWPGQNTIGKKVWLDGSREATVIGVCGDARYMDLRKKYEPKVYLPMTNTMPFPGITFSIRTEGDPRIAVPFLKKAIRTVDPSLPIDSILVGKDMYERSIATKRFQMSLFAFFAVLALVMATIGVYGLVHYTVEQRTREISIRIAVGANQKSILTMVVMQATVLAVTGVGIGLLMFMTLRRFIASYLYGVGGDLPSHLYGVGASEAPTLAVISLFLICVAVTASVAPARNAMSIDPALTLKAE